MNPRTLRGLAAGALAALVAAGCHSGSSDNRPLGGAGGTGGQTAFAPNVALRVADAPFATACFTEASVTISEIDLHLAGASATSFVAVTTGAQTYNLLDLAGGVSEAAGSGFVAPGIYDEVRIVVSEGVLTFDTSPPAQLTFPLSSATGAGSVVVALSSPLDVQASVPLGGTATATATGATGTATTVVTATALLDFDLASSFAPPAGTPPATTCAELATQGIQFAPVVRAVNTSAATGVTGIVVSGATAAALGGVTVSTDVLAGNGLTAPVSTITSQEGTLGGTPGQFVLFLPPGTFTLTFSQPGEATTTTQTVVVPGSGGMLNVGTVTLP